MRKITILTGLAGLAVLAGCGTSVAKTPATPASSTQAPASSSAPATPAAASSSQDDLTGPVGTEYTVTTQDESGNDVKYTVAAVKVLDPARGSDEFEVPSAGSRFVGVQFKVTGDGGYAHDNANSDALVQGSDGQVYTADFSSITAGTNFNSGDFSVTSGRSVTGWVTFQVPKGVAVDSVQWQPDSFSDQQPAVWTVH